MMNITREKIYIPNSTPRTSLTLCRPTTPSNIDTGCEKCRDENPEVYWCIPCNSRRLQREFFDWSSGNYVIDEFIRDAQSTAHHKNQIFFWIPYEQFEDIKYIGCGGFGKVFRARWIEGRIFNWSNQTKNWIRDKPGQLVALKSINNSSDITSELVQIIKAHVKFHNPKHVANYFGFTQDPKSKNYMLIMRYAEYGSIRNYICNDRISWKERLDIILEISVGLKNIHNNQLCHQNFHTGNILYTHKHEAIISDLGISQPAGGLSPTKKGNKKRTYGVLPYVPPEVLRGQPYTKASDIYSFGIVIWEICSGEAPFNNIQHDSRLAASICKGLRPEIKKEIPPSIAQLIQICWDANPFNRPSSDMIRNILYSWWVGMFYRNEYTRNREEREFYAQIMTADNNDDENEFISNVGIPVIIKRHPKAIYISRLLNFSNLPEPRNRLS